jgi:hypothetical protein
VGFFWDQFNTHQCSYVTRADRRVEGLVAEGWVGGRMGGGMDTNIYIACLRQVVAFAPKVIIIACLRQVVAFAPKVIIITCLRQGFCIRKTR